MRPTRDRLLLIVPPFLWGCGACYGRHVQGALLFVCVCLWVHIYACVCVLLPLVLLFPAVISEGKVIRCLIGRSASQSAPYGVCVTCKQLCVGLHTHARKRTQKHTNRHTHTEDMCRILGSKTVSWWSPNRVECGKQNVKWSQSPPPQLPYGKEIRYD